MGLHICDTLTKFFKNMLLWDQQLILLARVAKLPPLLGVPPFLPLFFPCPLKPFIFSIFPPLSLLTFFKMDQVRTISDRIFGTFKKLISDWTRKWTKKGPYFCPLREI